MKVNLERIEKPFLFEIKNETGNKILVDASQSIGGSSKGVRPMELLLMGLAGCASIDVIHILKKQQIEIESYSVVVDGERESGKEANLFHEIKIHFFVKGIIEENKLKRAIELSLEKYCSVAKTLEKTAKIIYTYELK